MRTSFTSEFFTGNREKLRQSLNSDAPIVVTANGLLQRGADGTYAFAQDANFWYLTGLDEPDLLLVMDADTEYLIVPARSASRQAFDGAVASGPLTRRSGIKTVYDDQAGWEQLTATLKKAKQAAILSVPPAYVEQYGLYTNPARAALAGRLKTMEPSLDFVHINPFLTRLRAIKQPIELQAIQAAIDITVAAVKQIIRPTALAKYAYEYEVEAELSRAFRRGGAAGHAFEPVVAGGERACTLHNVANNGALAAGELLLIDVGAEVEHYAADITRTVSLRKPSARQQTVYDAVLDVQMFAFGLLKPGVLLKEYEQKIENYMGQKLQELGLIKTINHKNVRKFYPHGTSHFLGLNVHDVGEYDRPLEPGMVLTVEPGIYIAKEGIGIRIEDDVLVTAKATQILTAKLPRKLG